MTEEETIKLKNHLGIITYVKATGEIVAFKQDTQFALSLELDNNTELLTQEITMEDADGAEITMPVPVQVPGVGEMQRKTDLPAELDHIYITRADTKDEAYGMLVPDVTLSWSLTGMNINGEDVDVQHSPKWENITEVINDPVKGPIDQPRLRPIVKSDDDNFNHIDTRTLLVSTDDWPLTEELSSYLEDKQIDHANRRIIDAD